MKYRRVWMLGAAFIITAVSTFLRLQEVESFTVLTIQCILSVMSGALIGGFLVIEWMKLSDPGLPERKRRRSLSLWLLSRFAWFCSPATKEHIEAITADLQKDRRQMKQQGHSRLFISLVMFWHSIFGTIMPIAWDGLWRVLTAMLPVAKLITGIKGLFIK